MGQTDLAKAMLARVELDGLAADHALRTRADAFDSATEGYFAKPQTVTIAQFMVAWARARRTYCDYTGEPLI
ncbi:MAG: hypothetical protein M3O74_13655 [Pseudomonadota bacterium]|nr:hypothetical protein [Pseudomonadota bacterium]